MIILYRIKLSTYLMLLTIVGFVSIPIMNYFGEIYGWMFQLVVDYAFFYWLDKRYGVVGAIIIKEGVWQEEVLFPWGSITRIEAAPSGILLYTNDGHILESAHFDFLLKGYGDFNHLEVIAIKCLILTRLPNASDFQIIFRKEMANHANVSFHCLASIVMVTFSSFMIYIGYTAEDSLILRLIGMLFWGGLLTCGLLLLVSFIIRIWFIYCSKLWTSPGDRSVFISRNGLRYQDNNKSDYIAWSGLTLVTEIGIIGCGGIILQCGENRKLIIPFFNKYLLNKIIEASGFKRIRGGLIFSVYGP